jgi:senataxin
VFFDVNGTERRPDGASWANDDEARLVAALVKRLIADYPSLLNEDEVSGAGVGVISPYKAQVKVIRKFLEQALGSEKARFVDVNSVDGFQGREKEVCVFSVTRAPRVDKKDTAEETKQKKNLLGFVADERRVNVGLTRARSSLLVVGSAKALQTDVHWGGLVKSATDRKLIVKPTGGKTAAAFDAFVAKHSAQYDEDDLSGDEDDDAVITTTRTRTFVTARQRPRVTLR